MKIVQNKGISINSRYCITPKFVCLVSTGTWIEFSTETSRYIESPTDPMALLPNRENVFVDMHALDYETQNLMRSLAEQGKHC